MQLKIGIVVLLDTALETILMPLSSSLCVHWIFNVYISFHGEAIYQYIRVIRRNSRRGCGYVDSRTLSAERLDKQAFITLWITFLSPVNGVWIKFVDNCGAGCYQQGMHALSPERPQSYPLNRLNFLNQDLNSIFQGLIFFEIVGDFVNTVADGGMIPSAKNNTDGFERRICKRSY